MGGLVIKSPPPTAGAISTALMALKRRADHPLASYADSRMIRGQRSEITRPSGLERASLSKVSNSAFEISSMAASPSASRFR